MCVVSAVGDYYRKETYSNQFPNWGGAVPATYVTAEEFAKLKQSVEEIKTLLLAAKKYDEAMGEPECHMDEKVALIKKLAEIVMVNMDEVFK